MAASTEVSGISEAELTDLLDTLEAEVGVTPVPTPKPIKAIAAPVAEAPPWEGEELEDEELEDEELEAMMEATFPEAPPVVVNVIPAGAPIVMTPAVLENVTAIIADDIKRVKAAAEADSRLAHDMKALADRVPTPLVVKPEDVAPEPKPAASRKPTLDYFVDAATFKRETAVSDTNLDSAMMEQNSLRSHYGVMSAQAEAQAARMKVRFEVLEAQMFKKQRAALDLVHEKVTEKMVEVAVKLEPDWLAAKNAVIEADCIFACNKALVQSLSDRRDMIIQLGADRRDEQKGQVRTMVREQEKNDLRNRAVGAFTQQ